MAMYGPQFINYYLASTKVGTKKDCEIFFDAWERVYGTYFNNSTPWTANPDYRVPKIVSKVETAMKSFGADAASAKRVCNAFKKWYNDMYN